MDGSMLQVFRGFLFFEKMGNRFDILSPVFRTNKRRIGRIDHNHIVEPNGRNHPTVGK